MSARLTALAHTCWLLRLRAPRAVAAAPAVPSDGTSGGVGPVDIGCVGSIKPPTLLRRGDEGVHRGRVGERADDLADPLTDRLALLLGEIVVVEERETELT